MVTAIHRAQDRRLKSPFLIKKDDPGVPSIECTINVYSFQKTLYDAGSDVNIMATVTYQLLHGTGLYNQHTFSSRWFSGHWHGRRRVRSTHHPWKTVPQHYQSHHLYWNRRSPHALPLWRRRRNRNQRRQIIKDGWADYEGEVVRSEDIQLEQNCPEENVAPSQVWREKITIHEEEAPPEPPTTPSSESQDDWENGESRSEDLKNRTPCQEVNLIDILFFLII